MQTQNAQANQQVSYGTSARHGATNAAGSINSRELPQKDAGMSTSTETKNPDSTSSKLAEGASGLKGLATAVHGAGEAIRGNFNAAVDKTFDEPAGAAKNDAIAKKGEEQIDSGVVMGDRAAARVEGNPHI